MNKMTYVQHLELIDIAANENRLWHHNGGQAYIKLSNDSNVLMIIDHVNVNNPTIELCDGTQYFEDCKGYNFVHSRRIRQLDKTMVDWFITNFPEKAVL